MLVEQILIISITVITARYFLNASLYKRTIFFFSILAIFWFQPLSPIRTLDYWLPVCVILISILAWANINGERAFIQKENILSLSILTVFLVLLYTLQLVGWDWVNSIVMVPGVIQIIVSIILIIFAYFLSSLQGIFQKLTLTIILILLIGCLIILKSEQLSFTASQTIRRLNGQLTSLATAREITWVGYSYFSFRLIHVLADRKRVKELNLDLREFITFLIFFPVYISGPIDRVEHFIQQLRGDLTRFEKSEFAEGIYRITRGILYKYIFADSLALFSLDSQSSSLISHRFWAWIIVYSYALRIFLDFAGYTDIAIGIGNLAGFKLPENFKQPYLSRNITMFWNNWHITLSQWFRTYYFNPITRLLRTKFGILQPGLIILFTQTTTMVLIGLWHGISLNFLVWGLWNGAGLFIHNRWSSVFLPRLPNIQNILNSKVGTIISTLLTFNFVTLSWVWFALPTLGHSIKVLEILFGR